MKLKLLLLIFALVVNTNTYAAGSDVRVGLSVGGINWGGALVGVSYDQKGILKQQNWTAGGELDLLRGGFVLMPRALFWQKSSLSGFFGGPAASFGVVRNGHLESSYNTDFNDMIIGIGGEGGWVYRLPTKIDVGAAVDLQATSDGLWLGIKLTLGYLIR